MNKTNRNVLIYALIALILLIVAYANHFYNGFHFDDFHAVVNNVFIRNPKNIPEFFVNPKMFSSDPLHWGMRGLVTTTLAIDYWLGGGLDPFWFQFSTFFWHIVLCVLLFFVYKSVVKNTFKTDWSAYIALAAASWYGLHTANAETLNYIISRSDVLSTLLIVLSFFIYIKWPAKRKYGLYIIPAFFGVFAKETVLVLVIILFFYILLFEKELSIRDLFRIKNFKFILETLWQITPLIIVVVVTQVYTLTRIHSIPGISNPLFPYVLTQTYVWLHYFISFFLPVNLSADSDWTVIPNYFDERIIIGCIFVVGLFITIIRTSSKKEARPIAFGLIWFAAALLPTSLAPFAEVTNDHRMYFPFIGLTLSVVTYLGLLLKRYESSVEIKKYAPYLLIAAFCVLGLNAFGAYKRNKVWKDEKSLWYDVTVKSPANGRGLMNYGIALMAEGNYADASLYYKKASYYLPYYGALYVNMAILDGVMHKNEEAEQNYKAALSLAPDDISSYTFYAKYLDANGRFSEAETITEKALKLNPYSETALNTLMNVYNEMELWPLSAQIAQRLLNILPGDKNATAYLVAAQKHVPVITDDIKGAITTPSIAADYLNLSLRYYNEGLYLKCIDACNRALKLKPNYAEAYNNIGAAYNKLKQWDKGIDACKKALAIDPKNAMATGNLKFAESQVK